MGGGKLLELLLVLAIVLGFGLRELWVLRRDRLRAERDRDGPAPPA